MVPATIPVTIPVVLTVPVPLAVLLHMPPVTASVSGVAEAWHTVAVPVMVPAFAVRFTVTIVVAHSVAQLLVTA